MKAIGYVRVSTEEQAREGISLPAQEAKIRAYAELNDLTLIDVIADAGRSGKNTDRDGLRRVLAMVEARDAEAVIVYKLDRMSRRVVDTLTIIERIEGAGAALHSIAERVDTKSAIGKFFLNITASFAQMERDAIAERTALALAHKQAQGEHVGRVPYGSALENKRLVPVEGEAHVAALILALRRAGQSLQGIADELARRGIPTQRGGRWQAQTVSNILSRAATA